VKVEGAESELYEEQSGTRILNGRIEEGSIGF